jgi:hypothetical protein
VGCGPDRASGAGIVLMSKVEEAEAAPEPVAATEVVVGLELMLARVKVLVVPCEATTTIDVPI